MACQIRSLAALVCAVAASALHAQSEPPRRPSDVAVLSLLQAVQVTNAPALAPIINALLSDTAAHMRSAPSRPATAADSARAAAVVREIRASLARYADVSLAERDGYARFLPWLEEQVIYHYNSVPNLLAASARIDLARPSSLLYRKDADGRLRLVGAMYTAPHTASLEELDARLPRSFAHWHEHVNLCSPHLSAVSEGGRVKADSAEFARWLAIDTPEACAAAGGGFFPQFFGWMAHVNAFDGDDAWGHGMDHMSMHAPRDDHHHRHPQP